MKLNNGFVFHDVEQNTDEWFDMRAGKLTSSKLGVIMANFGKAFGPPAQKYAVDIAIERLTGVTISSGYSNSAMEAGHEMEPIAREKYEEKYFSEVSNGGFFSSDFIGCSPDGLVGEDGVIEIKSAIAAHIHYSRIKKNGIESTMYKWQCIGNLKFTDREWMDFISFCPQFPQSKELFDCRLLKDSLKDEFEMIDQRVDEFKALVSKTTEIIVNSKLI